MAAGKHSKASTSSGTGKGFGKSQFGAPPPVADTALWEREYKAFIRRCGAYVCSLSWQAYEKMGRGAVYSNYDGGKAAGTLSEADEKLGGIPSMFCPLHEFEAMVPGAAAKGEHNDLDQIIQRIKQYDPTKEFVVVFQAGGVCGADICSPSIPPPDVAKQVEAAIDIEAAARTQRVAMGADGRLGITYGAEPSVAGGTSIADAEWRLD
ncbi:hypothetical protein JKP88DRAFT_349879 [Tribonema minus]|uniref:Uncharacterized protein n=1 Tax=Tribonema minus TaxID=303371 RepID=A0A836CCX0_9STRA|nr:hypothetical protein JKP88DRAFT_349879 [Tribonema minus]